MWSYRKYIEKYFYDHGLGKEYVAYIIYKSYMIWKAQMYFELIENTVVAYELNVVRCEQVLRNLRITSISREFLLHCFPFFLLKLIQRMRKQFETPVLGIYSLIKGY